MMRILKARLTISNKRLNRKFCTTSGIIPVSEELHQSPTAILLSPKDYPQMFHGESPGSKKYAHPNDYKIDSQPIKPKIFIYKPDARNRIFFRTSFKLTESTYTAATFILDTGCTSHFNICQDLKTILESRIKISDSVDYIEANVNNDKAFLTVDYNLLEVEKPVNVIGLPMFFYLGISFKQQRIGTFQFDSRERIARDVCTFANFLYL